MDPFGISIGNDRALGLWRTARIRLITYFPALGCADLVCFIEMSTTPKDWPAAQRFRPYSSWLLTQSSELIAAASESSPAKTVPATISANL